MITFSRRSFGHHDWQRQPSLMGKILVHAILWIPIAGFLLGFLFSTIIPSDTGIALGLASGTVYGLLAAVMTVRAFVQSRREVRDVGNGVVDRMLRAIWVRAPLMGLAGLVLGYGAAAWGYPWLYNKAFGSQSQRLEIVSGFTSWTSKGCAHPEIGREFFVDPPRALCASQMSPGGIPVGSTLRLTGRASFLGMNVEEIEVVSMPPRNSQDRPLERGVVVPLVPAASDRPEL